MQCPSRARRPNPAAPATGARPSCPSSEVRAADRRRRCVRRSARGARRCRPLHVGDAPVAVFTRIAVDLESGIGMARIHVLRNPRSRVQALLDCPVVVQRLVRHLDDEQCRRRVCVPVVTDRPVTTATSGSGSEYSSTASGFCIRTKNPERTLGAGSPRRGACRLYARSPLVSWRAGFRR